MIYIQLYVEHFIYLLEFDRAQILWTTTLREGEQTNKTRSSMLICTEKSEDEGISRKAHELSLQCLSVDRVLNVFVQITQIHLDSKIKEDLYHTNVHLHFQ